MININLKIKEFLTEKGIMEKTVANKTGMSKQNLNVLLDNSDMKFSQYFKLCEALEVDYLYFLANKETINPLNNDRSKPDSKSNQANEHLRKKSEDHYTASQGSMLNVGSTVSDTTITYNASDVASLLKEIKDLQQENEKLRNVIEYLENRK